MFVIVDSVGRIIHEEYGEFCLEKGYWIVIWEGWIEYKSKETHYRVIVDPYFLMPKDMVEKFKKAGYKWEKFDKWKLVKETTNIAKESELIKSFGEQNWQIMIEEDVGKYTQVLMNVVTDEPNFFYDFLQALTF